MPLHINSHLLNMFAVVIYKYLKILFRGWNVMLLLLKNILKFILISVSPLSTLTPHCHPNFNAPAVWCFWRWRAFQTNCCPCWSSRRGTMNNCPWNCPSNCRGNSQHSETGSAPSLWWWAGGHQSRVHPPGRYSCLMPCGLEYSLWQTYKDSCPLNVMTVLLWPERPLLKYIFLRTCHLNSTSAFFIVEPCFWISFWNFLSHLLCERHIKQRGCSSVKPLCRSYLKDLVMPQIMSLSWSSLQPETKMTLCGRQ